MSIYGNPVIMGGSGGGGGSTNVLSGTTTPTAAQGNNGAMYLQYSDAGLKNATGQYINTGYNGKDNSRYVIDFMLAEGQTIKYPTPFGARSAPNAVDNASYLHLGNGSNYTSGYAAWGNYQATTSLGASAIIGKRITIELSKSAYAYTVDGQRTEISLTGGTITNTTPIGIFTALCNSSPLTDIGISGMVLYSFTIYEGDTLVHRYIPALDSNDVACVYDEVTDQYIYHSGGGTLQYIQEGSISATYAKVNSAWQDLIGTDIDDIDLGGGGGGDDPFALTAYIESSGTQWINTGYLANDNTKIEIVVNVNAQNAAYASLFGARNAAYDTATKAFVLYRDNTAMTAFVGAKPGKASVSTALYFGQKTVYALAKNSLSVKGADGINHYGVGFTGGTVDNENSIYLLSFNQAGSDAGPDVHCSAKLYRCRIFEGSTLVHEYLPWQENGVACLKDTVSGNLKYNAGTGSFVYGVDA